MAGTKPSERDDAIADKDCMEIDYLSGWRLHFLTLSLVLSLFLASLEVSIVSTALVPISVEFDNFDRTGWIIAAYLLTYTGFLIIWAKFSDIWGRKTCTTLAITIFIAFSGACGGAKNTTQLIIFRAFQGMGGSGMTSVTIAMIPELVPPAKYALYSSITASSFAFSYLLGPLLGAVINQNGTWRWIFYLNLPAGAANFLVLHLSCPNNFPHHLQEATGPAWYSKKLLRRLDVMGCFLLLGASCTFVAALEEAGVHFKWGEWQIITLLCVTGSLWLAFLGWELYATRRQEKALVNRGPCPNSRPPPDGQEHLTSADSDNNRDAFPFETKTGAFTSSITTTIIAINQIPRNRVEPVFPWRFVRNRVFFFMLMCGFAAGVPFTASIITIPQRLQIVNGQSPFDAGVRLLPFAIGVPVGSILQSTLGKKGVPAVALLLAGSLLQVAGTVAQLFLPKMTITAAMYAEQVITGLGVGINLGILVLWTPFMVRGADTAVAMSAITQIRALGGVVGIAIVTNIFNTHVGKGYSQAVADGLMTERQKALLQTSPYQINTEGAFTPEVLNIARTILAEGYALQMNAIVAFAAMQVVTCFFMLERGKIRRVDGQF